MTNSATRSAISSGDAYSTCASSSATIVQKGTTNTKAANMPRSRSVIGNKIAVELTPDPGWAYCPSCNDLTDWQADYPNCPSDGLCRGRSILPIPTTLSRELGERHLALRLRVVDETHDGEAQGERH